MSDAPTIYQAHPITGEYVGAFEARPDPLVEGRWLIPAAAYTEAPPDVAAGFVAAHVDGADEVWSVLEDHRGVAYSTTDGTEVEWLELGALPDGLTTQAPPSADHVWNGSTWEVDESAQAASLALAGRQWRDETLAACQWPVVRHRDQVDAGGTTTITAEQYRALLVYRQALRDWPAAAGFPAESSKPVAPDWLASLETNA